MRQHLFLHVPKTAGSSIRTLLQQNYDLAATIGFSGELDAIEWYQGLAPEARAAHSLVHGHFPYGLHDGVPHYTYFTFLRDPVARHFSDYHFLKRYADHPLHPAIASGAITLEDWATDFERLPQYRNRTTRYISGEGVLREPDRLSLERARFNVLRDFTFVGLAERFDESVLILARRLGWKSVFYLTKNVSASPEIPDAFRARAKEHFTLDLELYAWAQRQFEASPELADPLFADALEEFLDVRRWLEDHLANNQNELFVVGGSLPSLDAVAATHRATPALDQYLGARTQRAA